MEIVITIMCLFYFVGMWALHQFEPTLDTIVIDSQKKLIIWYNDNKKDNSRSYIILW